MANCHFLAYDLSCAAQAGAHAFAAHGAFCCIGERPVFGERDGLLFADFDALAALGAATDAETRFRIPVPAFRIMALAAFQWTALEKDGCSDARPVVYGVFLDVEDVPADLTFALIRSRRRLGRPQIGEIICRICHGTTSYFFQVMEETAMSTV